MKETQVYISTKREINWRHDTGQFLCPRSFQNNKINCQLLNI